MMKDSTEFKQRFAAWKAGKKVYDAGKPIPKYDGGTDDDDFLRHVAYRIMSQTPEAHRSVAEISQAVQQELNGDSVDLQYTGSYKPQGKEVVADKNRDLNKLVLYGNIDHQFVPTKPRGFKYKKFLADNYNLQNTKTYEGHIDNLNEVLSPTDYKGLISFLADNPQFGMYVNPEEDFQYELYGQPNRFNNIDDTASYRRSIRRDAYGNPELASQDIIDYTNGYQKHGLKAAIQGWMLSQLVPYPIMLDQSTPIRFTNNDTEYTGTNSIEPTLKAIINNNRILRPLIKQNADYEYPMPLEEVVVRGDDPEKLKEMADAYKEEWEHDDLYDKGKSIHINPANKGKFNATKKRTGKTTEQLAHSKNPLTRKRAIFALNARKWNH